jgi:hypothetical protein
MLDAPKINLKGYRNQYHGIEKSRIQHSEIVYEISVQ